MSIMYKKNYLLVRYVKKDGRDAISGSIVHTFAIYFPFFLNLDH